MGYFHLNVFRFMILFFLISSKLCTVFTSFSHLHFNLYKIYRSFFIIILWFSYACLLSCVPFFNYEWTLFIQKLSSLASSLFWHFSNIWYFLIRYIGDIFLFLHLSLCPLVSKLPIETTLTKFSLSNYNDLYTFLSPTPVSYSVLGLETSLLSLILCIIISDIFIQSSY